MLAIDEQENEPRREEKQSISDNKSAGEKGIGRSPIVDENNMSAGKVKHDHDPARLKEDLIKDAKEAKTREGKVYMRSNDCATTLMFTHASC